MAKPSFEEQLGCAMIKRRTTHNGRRNATGAQRFSKIVISETMSMIWKARCDWRIEKESDPERAPKKEEIRNKLKATLVKRIKMDYLAMDMARLGSKATEAKIVNKTWKTLLPGSVYPAKLWRVITKVLVGIG